MSTNAFTKTGNTVAFTAAVTAPTPVAWPCFWATAQPPLTQPTMLRWWPALALLTRCCLVQMRFWRLCLTLTSLASHLAARLRCTSRLGTDSNHVENSNPIRRNRRSCLSGHMECKHQQPYADLQRWN